METDSWSISIAHDEISSPSEKMSEVTCKQDVRERVKIACLTLDRLPRTAGSDGFLHRGWARPRMWEQYADHHTGVCLVFDKKKFENAFAERVSEISSFSYSQPIKYADGPLGLANLSISAKRLLESPESEVLDEFIEERAARLFFRKNLDWESESEIRYLLVSANDHEPISIRQSLAGIVVGPGLEDERLPEMAEAMLGSGLESVPVAALYWSDGTPRIWDASTDDIPQSRIFTLPTLDLFENGKVRRYALDGSQRYSRGR
jgi:hypothetical protein